MAQVQKIMQEEMSADNAWLIAPDWSPDKVVPLNKRVRLKLRAIVPKNIL